LTIRVDNAWTALKSFTHALTEFGKPICIFIFAEKLALTFLDTSGLCWIVSVLHSWAIVAPVERDGV